MTIAEMRLKISEVYPGQKWHQKCSKMPPNQVVAVYKSLEKRNFDSNYGVIEEEKTAPKEETNHQMDIFEWMLEITAKEKLEQEAKIKEAYEFKEDDHSYYGRVNDEFIEFESEAEYQKYLHDQSLV